MPKRFTYRGKMQQLREERGGKCECGCGGTEQLEFAHRQPTKVYGRGRGLAARYHDIRRNPEKYVLLTKRCHKRQELEMAVQRIKARPVLQTREPGDDTGQEDD